jgi:hypothetical protein
MEIGPMAITIRNKTTEELIRKIGRRTGEGPSAVVRRLVEREASNQNDQKVPEEEVQRRLRFMHELREKYPPPDPKPSWEDIQRDIDALYDYLNEPDDPGAKDRE